VDAGLADDLERRFAGGQCRERAKQKPSGKDESGSASRSARLPQTIEG